jgi:hypothetical protein
MKKLLFAAIALAAFVVSCDKKPSLSGSEFANPNIVAEGVDEMWIQFKHGLDHVSDSVRNAAIAEAEESAQRELTDDELAEIDRQLNEQIDVSYTEGRHQLDSLKQNVKCAAVLTFKDDEHMTLRLTTEAVDDHSDLRYEGTYKLVDSNVFLTYDEHKDTLVLSSDGNQLTGRLEENSYKSTLTKTK